MSKEEKQQFEYWLTNNVNINKQTAMLIIRHVEQYFTKESETAAQRIKELEDGLMDIIEIEEQKFKAEKATAEWFNNNMPGVGETLNYQTYSALPKWVESAKQLLTKK